LLQILAVPEDSVSVTGTKKQF